MYCIVGPGILRFHIDEGGGWNRIGRREKWPKQSWEEGEIGGGGVGMSEKKKSKRLGRREKLAQKVGSREKLAQKVGRRDIYPPVPPSS